MTRSLLGVWELNERLRAALPCGTFPLSLITTLVANQFVKFLLNGFGLAESRHRRFVQRIQYLAFMGLKEAHQSKRDVLLLFLLIVEEIILQIVDQSYEVLNRR